MTPRNPNRTLARSVSDDFRSTDRFIADMRRTDEVLDSVQGVLDGNTVDDRILRAVIRCQGEIAAHHPDDPNHLAARCELVFVTSWPYRVWLELVFGLRRMLRAVGRDLLYACIIPLKLILILIFNVAAFLLVWWLLVGF
jgi:hypothetical protein